jgi:DNA-binding NarL/FixJ family response regulator
MTRRTKVLIVDDHPLFRGGLRQVILDDGRFELAGETGDGEEALRLIQEKKPDVAVLDVKLPGLTGLEIARKLQEKRSRTHVIMLTMHNEEDLFNRALDSGAMGFVLKENAVEEIVKAIVAVADGQHYLSSTISGYLVRRRHRSESLAKEKPGLDDLTKAELRILKLISQKKTSREIGAELFISPRTVEAHRANICSKLGLRGSHSLLWFVSSHKSELQAMD